MGDGRGDDDGEALRVEIGRVGNYSAVSRYKSVDSSG